MLDLYSLCRDFRRAAYCRFLSERSSLTVRPVRRIVIRGWAPASGGWMSHKDRRLRFLTSGAAVMAVAAACVAFVWSRAALEDRRTVIHEARSAVAAFAEPHRTTPDVAIPLWRLEVTRSIEEQKRIREEPPEHPVLLVEPAATVTSRELQRWCFVHRSELRACFTNRDRPGGSHLTLTVNLIGRLSWVWPDAGAATDVAFRSCVASALNSGSGFGQQARETTFTCRIN